MRAATLTASPMTVTSCRVPTGPAKTRPLSMPTRTAPRASRAARGKGSSASRCCARSAACTARSASWSPARGTPKTAISRSPAARSRKPPIDSTLSATAAVLCSRMSRTSSAGSRSERRASAERSTNITVHTRFSPSPWVRAVPGGAVRGGGGLDAGRGAGVGSTCAASMVISTPPTALSSAAHSSPMSRYRAAGLTARARQHRLHGRGQRHAARRGHRAFVLVGAGHVELHHVVAAQRGASGDHLHQQQREGEDVGPGPGGPEARAELLRRCVLRGERMEALAGLGQRLGQRRRLGEDLAMPKSSTLSIVPPRETAMKSSGA